MVTGWQQQFLHFPPLLPRTLHLTGKMSAEFVARVMHGPQP